MSAKFKGVPYFKSLLRLKVPTARVQTALKMFLRQCTLRLVSTAYSGYIEIQGTKHILSIYPKFNISEISNIFSFLRSSHSRYLYQVQTVKIAVPLLCFTCVKLSVKTNQVRSESIPFLRVLVPTCVITDVGNRDN